MNKKNVLLKVLSLVMALAMITGIWVPVATAETSESIKLSEIDRAMLSESIADMMEDIEAVKNFVLDHYEEAYEVAYAYAYVNGYIDDAVDAIDQVIEVIVNIDLSDVDVPVSDVLMVAVKAELDAVVPTLVEIKEALQDDQFATVDGLVEAVVALEDDLYTHLDNIAALLVVAAADLYAAANVLGGVALEEANKLGADLLDKAEKLEADLLNKVEELEAEFVYAVNKLGTEVYDAAVKAGQEAYAAMVEQVLYVKTVVIPEIEIAVKDAVVDVQDTVDAVVAETYACLVAKISEVYGLALDASATVEEIIVAVCDHVAHIYAGEISVPENFFYLAITDGSDYASLVAEALNLREDEFKAVTMDEVTVEDLMKADFITVSYNDESAVEFAVSQVMGVANVYLNGILDFVAGLDAKITETYKELADVDVMGMVEAEIAKIEGAAMLIALVSGMEVVELDWAAVVGEKNVAVVDELRANLTAALVAAGIPETYTYTFDVVDTIVNATTLPLSEEQLKEDLGEYAALELNVPVAALVAFAAESALYEYVSYNVAYATTLLAVAQANPDAIVAVLGNYNRYPAFDYEFEIGEVTLTVADLLAAADLTAVLPEELVTVVEYITSIEDIEITISAAEAVEQALAAYVEAADQFVNAGLAACDEAQQMIENLLVAFDEFAGQVAVGAYVGTWVATEAVAESIELFKQYRPLFEAYLASNPEYQICTETVSLAELLAYADIDDADLEKIKTIADLVETIDAEAYGETAAEVLAEALNAYEAAADCAVRFELAACEEAKAMIAELRAACDAYVYETAEGVAALAYTVIVPVSELAAYAEECTAQFEALVESVLNFELVVGGGVVSTGDILDAVANITSIHPFAYAVLFRNVFYVDIPDAAMGGDAYIAAQILDALTATCEHYYDGVCSAVCSRCGEMRDGVAGHDWIPATCQTLKTCAVCGATDGDYADHNWAVLDCSTEICANLGCGITRKIAGGNHAYNEGEVIVAPTCTTDGETKYTCAACGVSYVSKVAALGHTEVIDAAVAATCTTEGKTEGKHCSTCSEVFVAQETIAALGHTEVVDAAVAATCTTEGKTEGKSCSACGEVFVAQETIAALGHTEVVSAAVAATCTTEGKTEGKTCSVCNEVLVAQETVAALGHTEVVDAAVAATCTTEGKTEGKHCSVCNEVLVAQETIAALGHTPEEIPATDGFTAGSKCSVCGAILVAPEAVAKEGANLLWLWITIPSVAVVGGGAAALYFFVFKKRI